MIDVIHITDVTLEELSAQRTNCDEEREEAQAQMVEIKKSLAAGTQDVHLFSTKVVDANRKLLLSIFSHKILDNSSPPVPCTFKLYKQAENFILNIETDKK